MASLPFSFHNTTTSAETLTLVCQDLSYIRYRGVWRNRNPLAFAVPLLLLQLSIISVSSIFIGLCLHPLKQSSIVAQIFGGMVLGPSFLGRIKSFASVVFPMRGAMVIETFASFGLMFFFFGMGVKMDPKMMLKPGRISLIIGLSVFFSTLAFTTSLSLILRKYISMHESLYDSLPYLAASQALTSFPNIACLLTELKLLNSDLARLAMKTSMFCDMLGLSLSAICFSMLAGKRVVNTSLLALLAIVIFTIFIFYVFRPIILWVLRNRPEEMITGELFISVIFTIVLVAGLGSDIIGQHFAIGSMMIGLAVPDGPPLGAALVGKLDLIVTRVLYPTFLTVSGLQTNMFILDIKSVMIVLLVVLFATLVKIGTVLLAGHFTNVSLRDAIVLGLLLNSRGICELVIYKFLKDNKILHVQEFTLAVISVLAVMIIITPLVRILYDPPNNQTPMRRRTIQQSKQGIELRILVCIHNQDNVPAIMNLLEASNATHLSPISITALILVELVGRTTPMLIAHNPNPTLDTNNGHIINALHGYEVRNEGHVSIQSFSCISLTEMMHENICRMALDQNATIVIAPFHKNWAIDGTVGSVQRKIQNINTRILTEAPCSVGILIDRGILRGPVSTFNNQSRYRVLILYIGGPDDVECLSYGARMAGHLNVTLTIIRFLLLGYDTTSDFKKESDLINCVRDANEENEDFLYREQVVRDGVGLSACIHGLEDCFELIIAGRNHKEAALLRGLEAWSECPELGPVGDMLASPDFGKTASVLVVQQQRIGRKLVSRGLKPVVIDDNDVNRESTPCSRRESRDSNELGC